MPLNPIELRVARIRREVSQAKMAAFLGITESGYCMKEKGKRAFSLADVQAITKFLSLTPREVLLIFFNMELNSNGKETKPDAKKEWTC